MVSFHFSPKIEFPVFEGMNPREWIKKCRKYFSLCKVPDSQKLDVASMHTRGKAEIWFNSYVQTRKNIDW